MQNKEVVLITGCSSGMGKDSALYLANKGYTVYAGSRTPDRVPIHTNIYPIYLDITNPKSVQECIAEIPRVDVLINNAGYGLISTVEDLDETEMFDQFNVNVFGLLRVCKSVIPMMREQQGGVIINISSFLGKIGLPLLTMYNASKYAVEGVTDSLRHELHNFDIRVHSIMPGFFDTEFARSNIVTNDAISNQDSAYANMVSSLAPNLLEQINQGNDVSMVSKVILEIIEDEQFPARTTVGDKASKFIPMRRELNDEDFERRVREYYGL